MNFGSYDCRKNVNSVLVTLGAYELEDTELWYLTDYEERKDLTNLRVVEAEARSQSAAGGSCAPAGAMQASNRAEPGTWRVAGDNASATISDVYPSLVGGDRDGGNSEGADGESGSTPPVGTRPDSTRVPSVFRRRPMCRRVLHFTMKLINSNLNEDFELVGAQVFYNVQGRLR
jgi:hypothetical protein